MNAPKIFWLWRVTGGGQWEGVADSFGQAQQDAQACMENDGTAAVVEPAVLALNPATMRQEYKLTGRRSTASRVNSQIQWTPLDWTPDGISLKPTTTPETETPS